MCIDTDLNLYYEIETLKQHVAIILLPKGFVFPGNAKENEEISILM